MQPSQAVFLMVFGNNFRPEVVGDVMSGVAVEYVGMDVHVKLGDSRPNRSRNI